MRKYLLIGLIAGLALIALFVSQFFFRRSARPGPTPTPTPTASPSPSAPAIPITKDGNLEVIIGPNNSRIIVTINGLLEKINLDGVNANASSGQVTVDTSWNNSPVRFLGLLPDVAFIDDREGKYRTMSFFEFTTTRPEPNLYVACRPAFQTQTENFRCLALILRTGF
ncbi:MAG: hypothetical protein WAV56_02380 [Microgenomates group bacterium]